MGWFSSFFSPSTSSNVNARRNMALSTHDAFSLPTSSPLTSSHPYSFGRTRADTPDMEAATPSTYAYPPTTSSPTRYDYIPSLNARQLNGKFRPSSLLPLHRDSMLSPLPPYPPLDQTWARIRSWLSNEYPELGDTLNWGILPQDLNDIETAFGFSLPAVIQESYLVVDGQEAESAAGCSEGLFFGLAFLPLEEVLDEWRFWREVDGDPATGANVRLRDAMQSIPHGYVRRVYSQRGWIPLVSDKAGNYLGVDLNPDERGSVGQVIVFGRDFDTKVVLWRGDGPAGWARWLASFAEELENREGFEVGAMSDGSDGSEDGVGYESYFDNGGTKAENGGESTGLRLTGEYRGWNVLEAWADRSVKRWQEADALSDASKNRPRYGLGVIDGGSAEDEQGVEVEVPLQPDMQTTPTQALSNVTNRPNMSQNAAAPLPKAPAPRPLHLPSAIDFELPSPTGSRTPSFGQDLERGRQLSLDEVEIPLNTISSPNNVQTPPATIARRPDSRSDYATVKYAVLVPLPISDGSSAVQTPLHTSQSVPDLLHTDAPNAVQILPLEPNTSPTDTKLDGATLPDVGLSTQSTSHAHEDDPSTDANDTIRLVGGGGMSGVVAEPLPIAIQEKLPEVDGVEGASAASEPSNTVSSVPPKLPPGPKHEKKKSFSSGLKRLSKFGPSVKRKTESKENISTV